MCPRCTRETDGIAAKLLQCGIASEALQRNMPLRLLVCGRRSRESNAPKTLVTQTKDSLHKQLVHTLTVCRSGTCTDLRATISRHLSPPPPISWCWEKPSMDQYENFWQAFRAIGPYRSSLTQSTKIFQSNLSGDTFSIEAPQNLLRTERIF